METRNNASKTTSDIDNKNRIKEQFRSSQAFHQTPGVQFEPRNLESFDPVTQELYRLLPATIHTKIHKKNSMKEQEIA
jgi:hypothetical protein